MALVLLGGSAVAAPPVPRRPLRILQMNLCDSGIAGCYTGRAVAEAASVIGTTRPDVVTLDEVCRSDVDELRAALGSARGGSVFAMFAAAPNRRTGGDTRCRDGRSYGIGLLVALGDRDTGVRVTGRTYPTQDLSDPEERVWLCAEVAGQFNACVTHLASTSRAVALAQCAYLLGRAVPRGLTVVGGDLNLRDADVPDGYRQAGDGGVQHVIGIGDFAVVARATIGMAGTTDHPALLVTLTMPDYLLGRGSSVPSRS